MLRRAHLTPYVPEDAAEAGIGCGRCCALCGDHAWVRTTMTELTHGACFPGIGGLDSAAEAAGLRTVCQCEWADYPYSVLEKHRPEVPRSLTSQLTARFFEKQDSENRYRPFRRFSRQLPSPPQDSGGGFADERYLYRKCRVITELRPAWVLGENVAGFINLGLDKTIFDLAKAGYAVLHSHFRLVGRRMESAMNFIVAADASTTVIFSPSFRASPPMPGSIGVAGSCNLAAGDGDVFAIARLPPPMPAP